MPCGRCLPGSIHPQQQPQCCAPLPCYSKKISSAAMPPPSTFCTSAVVCDTAIKDSHLQHSGCDCNSCVAVAAYAFLHMQETACCNIFVTHCQRLPGLSCEPAQQMHAVITPDVVTTTFGQMAAVILLTASHLLCCSPLMCRLSANHHQQRAQCWTSGCCF